jgi:hypothetical protein
MDYSEWVKMFGMGADEVPVRDALAKAGLKGRIKIDRDDDSTSEDLPKSGITLEFTDESTLRKKGLIGRPILSSVLMVLKAHKNAPDVYTGALPFGLTETSQAALRKRFGKPKETSDDYKWDMWIVEKLAVTAKYAPDLSSTLRLTLSLPETA